MERWIHFCAPTRDTYMGSHTAYNGQSYLYQPGLPFSCNLLQNLLIWGLAGDYAGECVGDLAGDSVGDLEGD